MQESIMELLWSTSHFSGGNAPYVEELYESYLRDPNSVPDSWRETFDKLPRVEGVVGIDVPRLSALTFALGGAVTAVGGALISTFLTLDASTGVMFTLKALVIVIMGGVGDVRGTIVAALLLGLLETFVATMIDPGLTLAAA